MEVKRIKWNKDERRKILENNPLKFRSWVDETTRECMTWKLSEYNSLLTEKEKMNILERQFCERWYHSTNPIFISFYFISFLFSLILSLPFFSCWYWNSFPFTSLPHFLKAFFILYSLIHLLFSTLSLVIFSSTLYYSSLSLHLTPTVASAYRFREWIFPERPMSALS